MSAQRGDGITGYRLSRGRDPRGRELELTLDSRLEVPAFSPSAIGNMIVVTERDSTASMYEFIDGRNPSQVARVNSVRIC